MRGYKKLKNKTSKFLYVSILFVSIGFLVCFIIKETKKNKHLESPILIMGLDGLEWDLLIPLINNGRLPNITKLMEHGYYGKLGTLKPTISPAIWTTIATGKNYKKHGIGGFFIRDRKGNKRLIYSYERKTKALWNIFSDYSLNVWSIGWWLTYPTEDIKGIMISQTNTLPDFFSPQNKHNKIFKGTVIERIKGQVYPANHEATIFKILRDVDSELDESTRNIFGEFRYPLPSLERRLWENSQWAFRADTLYYKALLSFCQTEKLPDLTLLYFGGPDVVSHRFMRYKFPNNYEHKPSLEQVSNLGSVIDDYYIHCDGILGKLKTIFGPKATIIIVSDHGMKPTNLNAKFDPNNKISSHVSAAHRNKPPGVFIASGPNIRKNSKGIEFQNFSKGNLKTVCSVLDITPTILALKHIPTGLDMDGKVAKIILTASFLNDHPLHSIPTHDTIEFTENQKKRYKIHSDQTKRRFKQLEDLGYIE